MSMSKKKIKAADFDDEAFEQGDVTNMSKKVVKQQQNHGLMKPYKHLRKLMC